MISEDFALSLLDGAIAASPADQTEIVLFGRDSAVTRFAESVIHQNVAETNVGVSVRTVIQNRLGFASTNRIEGDALADAVGSAVEIARHCPPDPDFRSLPAPKPIPHTNGFVQATAECTPEQRAAAVRQAIAMASKAECKVAGTYSTDAVLVAIANSLDVRVAARVTEASIKVVAMSDGSAGYAAFFDRDVRSLPVEATAERAVQKALMARGAVEVPPGNYTVILEPTAVADMVSFLAYAGMGALSVQEKRSFMAGRFGQQIVSPLVSIWDDSLDRRTIGLPFDFEGVPKSKVVMIDRGVATSVVHDTKTAQKENGTSTGHALPAPNPVGPLPTNLFVGAGESAKEDLLASSDRAIAVTRFHYTNLEEPIRAIFTGMTRDGTYLVEGGKVKAPVKNLRFTQGILDALANVQAVSRECELAEGRLGLAYVPHLKIEGFAFTGVTEF